MIEIKNKYSRLDKNLMDKMIESKCVWLYQNYSIYMLN